MSKQDKKKPRHQADASFWATAALMYQYFGLVEAMQYMQDHSTMKRSEIVDFLAICDDIVDDLTKS
jgi:hypothetical protein